MTIKIESTIEVSEAKAAKLAEMIGAMVAVDDLFSILLGQFIQLSQDEPMTRTFGKEIKEAKAGGTFPEIEIREAPEVLN